MQNLTSYIPLRSFAEHLGKETFALCLHDFCSCKAQKCETPYGLSLLRKAITQFEVESKRATSKADMPFFRENQVRLVGPEVALFFYPLYESNFTMPEDARLPEEPFLKVEIDYAGLADYCISNNLNLIRCKYDDGKNLQFLKEKVAGEYDNIFYNRQETGFKPGSRFFSILYNACIEMENPEKAGNPEWRIVAVLSPEDAEYHFENGTLLSTFRLDIPIELIKRIDLPADNNRVNYTNLIGLLKKAGIRAEAVMGRMIDDD